MSIIKGKWGEKRKKDDGSGRIRKNVGKGEGRLRWINDRLEKGRGHVNEEKAESDKRKGIRT